MAAMKKFCCCCISLRTGGVIIGFLTLIAGLIMVTMSSIGLYGTLQKNDQVMEQSQREQDLTYDEAQAIVWGIRLWLGFYIAMSMIFVMCALLLIYGSLSSRRYFLVPYLVIDAISCVYLGLYFLYQVYKDVSEREGQDWFVIGWVLVAVTIAIELYFFICVYLLFHAMREERQRLQRPDYPAQSPYNPHMQVTYSQVPKM